MFLTKVREQSNVRYTVAISCCFGDTQENYAVRKFHNLYLQ